MSRSTGIKNRSTVIFNEAKRRIILSGIESESAYLSHLKDKHPYEYMKTVNKLLSL